MVVANVAFRVIPDSPEQAEYLTRREKKIARLRLSDPFDVGESHTDMTTSSAGGGRARCGELWAVLGDPMAWTTAGMFLLTNIAYSSLPVFLPSILTQMGHTRVASQALSVPPYLISFIAVLAVAKVSDALQSRAYLIAACALSSALGYAFLALSHRLSDMAGMNGNGAAALNMARYLAVYPAAAGFFCVVVLAIAWNINNCRGRNHKGAGFALMQVIGQMGPLIGTRLYPDEDGPWFTGGMGICAAAMLGVAGLALGLRAYLVRANRRADNRSGVSWGGLEEEEERRRLFAGEEEEKKKKKKKKSRENGVGFRYRYML